MGFTFKYRYVAYVPLPTLTTLKVLHLANKEINRLTAAHFMCYDRPISLTSVNRIIKYDLQLKCRIFSPINVPFFSQKTFYTMQLYNLCFLAAFYQTFVFNGKSRCCRTNLRARTTYDINTKKNIYSPV